MFDATVSWRAIRAARRGERWILTIAALLSLCALAGAEAPAAEASLGYEPDSSTPVIPLAGEAPIGIAVDQGNQRIYVAMSTGNFAQAQPGFIDQLESTGLATSASPFTTGAVPVFSGVAVDPVTHDIYAAEFIAVTPVGTFGASRIVPFSSTGTPGTPFATNNSSNTAPQIAVDSTGRIFYPSKAAGGVQIYTGSGAIEETITCAGCPGGAFAEPSSVALDSAQNLYVVDRGDGRVLKFTHSGGPYTYASTFQSDQHAVAVAVDTSNGSVLVGDYVSAASYHVVAYNSSGAQFDDFGAGLFSEGFLPVEPQIGINATTHKVYVGNPGTNSLRVFALVTINPPTATTEAASSVGQVQATMKATVNANYHATSDCHFEYADDAFFQAHGFTGSTQVPCSLLPNGSDKAFLSSGLSSLTPSTTYHYRISATNNAGTSNGVAKEFTTMPLAPATVTAEPASSVSKSAAKLNAKVNPHGGTVSSCKIEYGTSQSYGKSVSCPTPVGVVGTDVAESASVSGLSSATTYHYRLAVTTNAGSVNGDDVEFTTLSPPPEEPDPVEPAPSPQPQPITTVPAVVSPVKKLICRKGFVKRRVRGKLRCVKKPRRHRHR